MSAYVIAEVTVADPAAYEPYRALAEKSIARSGGRFIVRGGGAALLEGEGAPQRVVVIEFADAASARRWYDSEDYQKAAKIRQKASSGRLILVEGVG
jgi:uncharacterized protein (DUF1330 family)